MKKRAAGAIHFLILFAALVIQSSPVVHKISVGGVWPNMVFSVIFVYALYLKEREVICYAFIFGSATDLFFGNIYGVNALMLVVFALLFYFLNKFIYSESCFSVFLYMLAASILYEGVFLLINLKEFIACGFMREMTERYAVKCIYNAVFTLPVYLAARRIRLKNQEVRR